MSASELAYEGQLRGMPYETAKLYGMPNVGAKYFADDVNSTSWTGEYRKCVACGRVGGNHSKHHEPPKSRSCAKSPTNGAKKNGCWTLEAEPYEDAEPMMCEGYSPTSWLLCTKWGQFVLKPALLDLCGTGTTGCHGRRHNGLLRIEWEWDSPEHERKWWNGWFLSHGYAPHDVRFYRFGRYVFHEHDDSGAWNATWEYRGLL